MKNLLILLLSILSLSFASCEKEDDPTPQSNSNYAVSDDVVFVDSVDTGVITPTFDRDWVLNPAAAHDDHYEITAYGGQDASYPYTNNEFGDNYFRILDNDSVTTLELVEHGKDYSGTNQVPKRKRPVFINDHNFRYSGPYSNTPDPFAIEILSTEEDKLHGIDEDYVTFLYVYCSPNAVIRKGVHHFEIDYEYEIVSNFEAYTHTATIYLKITIE